MHRRVTLALTLELAVVGALTACGSASPSATSSAPATSPTSAAASPAASTTPGATPTPSPTTSPTGAAAAPTAATEAPDPCQVVTAAEAGALAGTAFGPGSEELTGAKGAGKRCTYGKQTTNVFFVQVGIAADAAGAQAQWTQAQAQVKAAVAALVPGTQPALTTTDVPGLGDRAVVATLAESLGGQTIKGTTIVVLKGTSLLAFGDLATGGATPTSAAMQAQARTSLARMP